MTDDIVDGAVLEDLPVTGLLGWCLDGNHAPSENGPGCPGTIWPRPHPDPARKGATYMLPGRRCSCVCHTRPVL